MCIMKESSFIHLSHIVLNLVTLCVPDGYFESSVEKNTNESVIQEYVKQQSIKDSYKQLFWKM